MLSFVDQVSKTSIMATNEWLTSLNWRRSATWEPTLASLQQHRRFRLKTIIHYPLATPNLGSSGKLLTSNHLKQVPSGFRLSPYRRG